jgi:PAS domain S-box-containing protein
MRSIRSAWPLRTTLPLVLGLLLLLLAGVAVLTAWRDGVRRLDASAEQLLRAELHRLARHASSPDDENPAELAGLIGHTATHPWVREVALLDQTGQVRLAHRRLWQQRPGAEVIEDWNPERLQRTLRIHAVELHWHRDEGHLSGLLGFDRPVFDAGAARQLEPAAVHLDLDLAEARLDLLRTEVKDKVPELIAIAGLMLLLVQFLRRSVTGPLRALQATGRRWAEGDLAARAPEQGPAEVTEVARAFNRTAGALHDSQRALHASRDHLATVLYSTGDALLATDAHQLVTLLNPVAERLTGWTEAQARGRPVSEVFRIVHAHTGAPAEVPVERVLQTGSVVGLANHTVLIARDGRRTHIADSAAPLREPGGLVGGVVLVFRDVTDTYRLQQALTDSEHHYRALANAGHALIWTCDTRGHGTWCNQPWLAYTGQSLEAALADDWLAAVHPPDLDAALIAWRGQLAQGQGLHLTLRLRRHDGSVRWMQCEAALREGPDGERQGHVLLAVDITQSRDAERRLQAQLDELRRWQSSVIGREQRVVELKAEVNTLLLAAGQTPRYDPDIQLPSAFGALGTDPETT